MNMLMNTKPHKVQQPATSNLGKSQVLPEN